jgi:hypothetical protein
MYIRARRSRQYALLSPYMKCSQMLRTKCAVFANCNLGPDRFEFGSGPGPDPGGPRLNRSGPGPDPGRNMRSDPAPQIRVRFHSLHTTTATRRQLPPPDNCHLTTSATYDNCHPRQLPPGDSCRLVTTAPLRQLPPNDGCMKQKSVL